MRVISSLFYSGWDSSATGLIMAIFTKILSRPVKENSLNLEKSSFLAL